MKKTKKITLNAMLCAFGIVFLYLAAFFPTLSLSFVAVAGFLPAIAIIECKWQVSALMTVATSILAFILVPDKSCAILYTLLFAPYPFVKLICEKIPSRVFSWIAKLLSVNVLLFVLYFCARELLLGFVPGEGLLIFAYIAFNVIFVLYDLCFTRICAFYFARIHRHIV